MKEGLEVLEKAIGYQFKDQSLLLLAVTHRSHGKKNNERLEFLGDSFLNFVVASELYGAFPKAKEGELSRLRANMVREETLAEIAQEFKLSQYLRLGIGEMKSGGAFRASILADAVEGIIGAIYLDSEMPVCYSVVQQWYRSRIGELSLTAVMKDPKSRLQELLQATQMPLPEYEIIETKGHEHDQTFVVSCKVALLDHPIIAEGASRRKAEQQAAENVLEELKKNG